jgi:hypothetical protein
MHFSFAPVHKTRIFWIFFILSGAALSCGLLGFFFPFRFFTKHFNQTEKVKHYKFALHDVVKFDIISIKNKQIQFLTLIKFIRTIAKTEGLIKSTANSSIEKRQKSKL